jgi:exopolyphosphatase
MSIRTFLITAKRHLQKSTQEKGTASFAIGNESADLDSITSALLYAYLQSSTLSNRRSDSYVIPVTNIPASDLPLRPELTALLQHANVKPSDLITVDDLGKPPLPLSKTEWTLVDHNKLLGALGEHYSSSMTGAIDHHEDEGAVPKDAALRVIEKAGSCSSLVTNYLRSTWDEIASASSSLGASIAQDCGKLIDDAHYTSAWDAQVAKLALASVLIDTYNMKDTSKVTEHDRKAVRYLEARINASPKYGKSYDRDAFFEEINAAKSDLNGLSLEDVLRKDYKQWSEGDLTLGVSVAVKPIEYLKTKSGSFLKSLAEFAAHRNLDIFALMTAYTDESGNFARQLLVLGLDDGKPVEAVRTFTGKASEGLKLADSRLDLGEKEEKVRELRLWNQGNVGASRKRVGPLLREAMRE